MVTLFLAGPLQSLFMTQKITSFLMFEGKAEEAMRFQYALCEAG